MNILMMTNTYLPHVGGVAHSVSAFTNEYRRRGHRVVVVAPEYKELSQDDQDTIRIPAIQNFNGSDFSVVLPMPGFLQTRLKHFKPDVVHSNHPFLIGSTAVRIASKFQAPLIYTHHTRYEQYLHYVPLDLPRMKTFVINLAAGYAKMADQVIAPSQSVADFLTQQGVKTPMTIIPTGIDVAAFRRGSRKLRRACAIPDDAFVVGHVGRLAPEKNLIFLAEAVASFLRSQERGHFMIAGDGPMHEMIQHIFQENRLDDRLHLLGKREGRSLVDAYHSMDVFAFSSTSETQGLVLAEAMAAGLPVVAIDGWGVRDVLSHRQNGFLVTEQTAEAFAAGLHWIFQLPADRRDHVVQNARQTAAAFSMSRSADKALALYEKTRTRASAAARDESLWHTSLEQIKAEWDVFSNFSNAVSSAIQSNGPD
ncbi:MAG: glycosyltransferase [Planctomycetaceae bacterium]|nr:glycosyltransferase [Planctomycetaceae bacterium]